jgi:hypothetical protein
LWDPETGKFLRGTTAGLYTTTIDCSPAEARFSADGRRLVNLCFANHSDAADRKVVIWAVPDEDR